MKTGLTLGKFAPLHKGHELMIESALAEVDRLVVIIYDAPETIAVPLKVRADWIRRLYPTVEVIEAYDGPTVVGSDPEITKLHDEYILKTLAGSKITHFYSSEFYGAHVSRALGAIDRRIDPDRKQRPVSATAVRDNLFENRAFVSPLVYRDMITKVVFVGAPSTGKTTLTEALAKRFDTVWMPEYGREYWTKHQVDRRLTLEQLAELAIGHREREDELILNANRYFFVDTDASTTIIFSHYYHGAAHPTLVQHASETRERYDLCFLCEDDIPYDDTADRSGEINQREFQAQIRADLNHRHVPYTSLRGSVEDRVETVSRVLSTFRKY